MNFLNTKAYKFMIIVGKINLIPLFLFGICWIFETCHLQNSIIGGYYEILFALGIFVYIYLFLVMPILTIYALIRVLEAFTMKKKYNTVNNQNTKSLSLSDKIIQVIALIAFIIPPIFVFYFWQRI